MNVKQIVMEQNDHHCVYCGSQLEKLQIDTIEKLKKSSAHCFAKGVCNQCWETKHKEKQTTKIKKGGIKNEKRKYF